MGTSSIIRPGDVQRMSAGTGVTHSEFNASRDEPVHFLQIWLLPARPGGKPGYEQKAFPEEERKGKLRLVASPDGRDGSVTIHQDVELYAGLLCTGETLRHPLARGTPRLGARRARADRDRRRAAGGGRRGRRQRRARPGAEPAATRPKSCSSTWRDPPSPRRRDVRAVPRALRAAARITGARRLGRQGDRRRRGVAAGAAARRRRGGDPHRGGVRQPDPLVPQRSVPGLQERRGRAARAARAVRHRRGGRARAGRRGLVDARARGRRRDGHRRAPVRGPGRSGAHHDARQGSWRSACAATGSCRSIAASAS